MENNMCTCKNCMGGCAHFKTEEEYKPYEFADDDGNIFMKGSQFVGFKHYCDIHPDVYDDWHKRNEHNVEYKNDELECYEPTEYVRLLGEMNSTLDEILKNVKDKRGN